MSIKSSYRHVQHAPLSLLLYVLAVVFLVLGLEMNTEPPIPWLFPLIGLFMLVLAASFHHLNVEDKGDRLSVTVIGRPEPATERRFKTSHFES